MKWLKVLALFVVLHATAWGAAHVYKSGKPQQVLLVADTSFALKPHFPAMQRWIDNYAESSRYRNILVGTDKAFIGELNDLRSRDVIFRVSFGRSSQESLQQYKSIDADRRLFLSDGEFSPAGWELVVFE